MIQICRMCDARAGGLVSEVRPMEPWPEPDLCPRCAASRVGPNCDEGEVNIPDYIKDSVEKIISIEWAVDTVEQAEGRTLMVDGDNWYELLHPASTVAYWVKSLGQGGGG